MVSFEDGIETCKKNTSLVALEGVFVGAYSKKECYRHLHSAEVITA